MALKDITRQEVLAAIAEYDRVGQPAFLSRYRFDPARLYLLVHEGNSYDSKAIVGAAHGFLPGEKPLTASQFSGGEATVGRLLRDLGFTVQVGDDLTADRLERLLTKFQVYRSDSLPALYQPITMLWAFAQARHGDPRLVSWHDTQRQVKTLLQRYGRIWEGDRVFYPVAALHRAGLWELDAKPEHVSLLEIAFGARSAEYQRLCAGADVFWQDRGSQRATRTSSVAVRSDDARRAVLLRSEGHCENPTCSGDIHDVTDTGTPILEVDYIHDLALGGDDNSDQMIALCPNCHQVKIRDSTHKQLRGVLFATAKLRHERLARTGKEGVDGRG
jgi:5-methylcytosine-specific restriction endonuclease McrA